MKYKTYNWKQYRNSSLVQHVVHTSASCFVFFDQKTGTQKKSLCCKIKEKLWPEVNYHLSHTVQTKQKTSFFKRSIL